MAPLIGPQLLLEERASASSLSTLWIMVCTAAATLVLVCAGLAGFFFFFFFSNTDRPRRLVRAMNGRMRAPFAATPPSPTPEVSSFRPDRSCVQRAALLSRIIYFNTAEQALAEVKRYHDTLGFEFVRMREGGDDTNSRAHKLIFAVDSESSTLYVCFRGSVGIQDLFTDSVVGQTELRSEDDLGALDGAVEGGFHRGFVACLNESVPSMRLLRTLHLMQGDGAASDYSARRVVFCGHSLGGALAHLALIKYMLSNPDCRETTPAIAIAFGGPHVCNATARDGVLRTGLGKRLHIEARLFNFVHHADPVPFLLNTIPHCASYLHDVAARDGPDWISRYMIVKLCASVDRRYGVSVAESVKWLAEKCLEQLLQGPLLAEAATRLSKIVSMALDSRVRDKVREGECKWFVPVGTWFTHGGIMQLDRAGETQLQKVEAYALESHRMATYFRDVVSSSRYPAVGAGHQDGDLPTPISMPQYDIAVRPNIRSAILDTSTHPIILTITGSHLQMIVKAQVLGVPDDVNVVWQVKPEVCNRPYRFELKLIAQTPEKRQLLQALNHNPRGQNEVELVTCFGEVQGLISSTAFTSVQSAWPESGVAEAYFRFLWKVALAQNSCAANEGFQVANALTLLEIADVHDRDWLCSGEGGLIVLVRERLRPMVDDVMRKVSEVVTIDTTDGRVVREYAASGAAYGAGVGGAVGGLGVIAGAALLIVQEVAFSQLALLGAFAGVACLPVAVGACVAAAGAAGYCVISEWAMNPAARTGQIEIAEYPFLLLLTRYTLSGIMPSGPINPREQEREIHSLVSARAPTLRQPQEQRIYTVGREHRGPGTISTASVEGCRRRAILVHRILEADAEVKRAVKVVLVVGPENAGKSSLINCILGKEVAKAAYRTHTSNLDVYSLQGLGGGSERVMLVDAPGVDPDDERDGAGKCAWQYMEGVPELVFVVLPFSGDVNEISGSLPREVVRRTRPSKLVLVLNRVDNVLNSIRADDERWSEFSPTVMSELKEKYARHTRVEVHDVVMTVLRRELDLVKTTRERLEERGVLFSVEAKKKFHKIISEREHP